MKILSTYVNKYSCGLFLTAAGHWDTYDMFTFKFVVLIYSV